MEKSQKEKALEKLKLEISNDISKLINISKFCGIGEFFYFIYSLHNIRVIKLDSKSKEDDKMIEIYSNQFDDSYKYIIQILFKHCQKKFIKNEVTKLCIDSQITSALTELVIHINSKYETQLLITLFDDVQVSGERDRYLRIDMSSVLENERLSKFYYYFLRIDLDNYSKKSEIKSKNDFLNYFKSEYEPYSDLFELEFKVEFNIFIDFIDFIAETISTQILENQPNFVYISEDLIDIHAYDTAMNFFPSLIIQKKVLVEKYGDIANTIINKLCFKTSDFNENQLRFNLISRQPIFDFGNEIVISPEILLDSLFVNSHYSFLEQLTLKDEYKKRDSNLFVDKITKVAKKYGYFEVNRELELYEGKNQIGDIDLILKNINNNYILIEAKNHSIPLDVFFHDYNDTEKRLTYLTNDWEKKVNKRNLHLKINSQKYNIPNNYTYIIVSKTPEIISHFSELLVLSLREFEFWLSKKNNLIKFKEIYEELYNSENNKLTDKQLAQINRDFNLGRRFVKE